MSEFKAAALLAAGLANGFVFAKGRKKKQLAFATVTDIENQIAALDPATRAHVIARLSRGSLVLTRDVASTARKRSERT